MAGHLRLAAVLIDEEGSLLSSSMRMAVKAPSITWGMGGGARGDHRGGEASLWEGWLIGRGVGGSCPVVGRAPGEVGRSEGGSSPVSGRAPGEGSRSCPSEGLEETNNKGGGSEATNGE